MGLRKPGPLKFLTHKITHVKNRVTKTNDKPSVENV